MEPGGHRRAPASHATDWIHCNRCMVGVQTCRNFSVTTCGHLFCGRCASNARDKTECLWCKNQCAYRPVNKDLSPQYQMFFKNPVEDLNNAVKCVRFQNMHRSIRLQHGKRLQRVYQNMRHELAALCEDSRRLDVAAKATLRELDHLRKQLPEQRRSVVPRAFTPSAGEFGFGYRISPYDMKCSGTSSAAVMPSFLERQNSARTQSTLLSRTLDSCSSLNTPLYGATSASSARFSPYGQPSSAMFPLRSRPNTPSQYSSYHHDNQQHHQQQQQRRQDFNSPFQQKLNQLSLNHSAKSTQERPSMYMSGSRPPPPPDTGCSGHPSAGRQCAKFPMISPMFVRRQQRPPSDRMSRHHPNISPPLVQD